MVVQSSTVLLNEIQSRHSSLCLAPFRRPVLAGLVSRTAHRPARTRGRDLSAFSAQGVCAYIASSSFECSSRTQQKNGDGRFSTLGDAVDTSGIVIFIVVRTYFVFPPKDSVAKAILPRSIFL